MLKARCLIGQYLMSFQLIGRERHLASINLKTSLSRIDINRLTNMQYNIAIPKSLYQHRYTHSEYIFTWNKRACYKLVTITSILMLKTSSRCILRLNPRLRVSKERSLPLIKVLILVLPWEGIILLMSLNTIRNFYSVCFKRQKSKSNSSKHLNKTFFGGLHPGNAGKMLDFIIKNADNKVYLCKYYLIYLKLIVKFRTEKGWRLKLFAKDVSSNW